MRRFMRLSVVIAVIFVLGTTATVFAATSKTPAQIVSGLTGKTADQIASERASGKTYGTIAKDSGKLEEFQKQMLEQKKAILDQRVKDGTLTKERADAIYKAIVDAQSSCDGTGRAAAGAGCGLGSGAGCGAGLKAGSGSGCGAGAGTGCGTGTCGTGASRGRGAGRGMGYGNQR